MIDNGMVQCQDFPIVETDAHGNTYQMRPLKDGSSHRVLKNFPTLSELASLAQALRVREFAFRELDNFWYCEYTLPPAALNQ
ncbi:MAG: hypothetical protein HYZ45_00610 [Burkholderiales bacterium]|nr:hypothetical protein [Burkholderiales bacterium]